MNHLNRQEKKSQKTKALLKDTFIELILEKNNIQSITVSEVTERADFNRATFYIHFTSKLDLLEELYNDAIEGIHQSIKNPYKNLDKVLINSVIPSNTLIFEYVAEYKRLFKALDTVEDSDIYRRLETLLWNLFTEEIYVERETDAETTEYELFLSFQVHATVGVIKYWIKNDFNYSTEVMSEQLSSFYSDKVTSMHFKNYIK